MRHSTFLIAATLFASCVISALAQSARLGRVITPPSSIAGPTDAGQLAHTNIEFLSGTLTGTPQAFGPPFPGYFYETPASIACIYNLQYSGSNPDCNPNLVSVNPSGGQKAIAIVDAYDYPTAHSDLATFSAQFGVEAITLTSFVVVYAPHGGTTPGSCTGAATQPPVDTTGGWELEEALDIEWAHAMAPGATLYLVEAQSNSNKDLFCAVTVASNLVSAAGGGEVSMSWGGGEFSAETTYDSVFTGPNVVYFASAGDSPGVSYPSASPNVVSVGGTTLSTDPIAGNFLYENVWQDTGSGPSRFEPAPTYQAGISKTRATPDVAADANPYTGVWVLDNFQPPAGCTPNCWYIVGGTSVSSPMWAGIVNVSNTFAASTNAELISLYGANRALFNDITLGSCGSYLGYSASAGWDFCSGLGSPNTYGRSK